MPLPRPSVMAVSLLVALPALALLWQRTTWPGGIGSDAQAANGHVPDAVPAAVLVWPPRPAAPVAGDGQAAQPTASSPPSAAPLAGSRPAARRPALVSAYPTD